jgi:protein-disulfide isomerase
VKREDLRQELEEVRRRRQEAARAEADLAHEEATLTAALGHELEGDTPADRAAARASTLARVEYTYGTLRSAADLTKVIRAWRDRIPGTSSLWPSVDASSDHVRGDPAAGVVIVEYGDYQCPDCAEAHGLYGRVDPWLEDGRLCAVFRHFPLVDAHPLALRAAQAAEAAATQGRFWEMHDELMRYKITTDDDRQEHVLLETPRDAGQLEQVARGAGLDLERFRADIDSPAALKHILEDFRNGLASGVNGTPTFYVNGRRAEVSGVDELYAQLAGLIVT